MEIAKKLGLTGLILGIPIVLASLTTNVMGYREANDRLNKYLTVDKAIEAHEKEFTSTGFPFDQLHNIFYEIGENTAYRQHNN